MRPATVLAIRLQIICGSVAALLAAVSGDASEVLEYEAKGYLTYYAASLRNPNSNLFNRHFVVNVRGHQWQIRMMEHGTTNGTNMTIIGSSNNSEIFAMQVNAGGFGLALVESNGYPRRADSFARFVWMGLCSHGYRESPPGRPPLILDLTGDESPQNVRGAWEKFSEPPCLPRRTVYFYGPQGEGAREAEPLASLPGERTNAACMVLQSTNLNGFVLPTHWVYEKYSQTRQFGPRSGFKVLIRIDCLVSALRLGSSLTNFLPPMPGNKPGVLDFRLAQANPPVATVQYGMNDSRWRPASDLRQVHEDRLAARKVAPGADPVPRKPNRWLGLVFLLFAALPPLVIAGSRSFRRSHRIPKSEARPQSRS
jgi:hypothetical protein